jgi:hypothetical protein
MAKQILHFYLEIMFANLCRGHVKKKLPPHPNIVAVYDWFVAETPLLEDALNKYPVALPLRLCPDGCARNKTLFIVMKRWGRDEERRGGGRVGRRLEEGEKGRRSVWRTPLACTPWHSHTTCVLMAVAGREGGRVEEKKRKRESYGAVEGVERGEREG